MRIKKRNLQRRHQSLDKKMATQNAGEQGTGSDKVFEQIIKKRNFDGTGMKSYMQLGFQL